MLEIVIRIRFNSTMIFILTASFLQIRTGPSENWLSHSTLLSIGIVYHIILFETSVYF